MSFQRRKSSGGVDVTGLDDVAERYSSKKKAASAAVDGSLDLTALTTIRRKSKASSDIQELNGKIFTYDKRLAQGDLTKI